MKDKMTWEETIKYIRTKPEYQYLVEKAYFEEDLPLNVERFRNSEEFLETLEWMKIYAPSAKKILDIGSGNGISSIAFALAGYNVVTVEPDNSDTIGAGAIRKLKDYYHLNNIEIFEAFAEEINFPDKSFDIVYARQCMHHAYDLDKFVAEMSRVLKVGGMFFTVRDHVIFDEEDKKWFLENHPLQKFYGGENAFTVAKYIDAIKKGELDLIKVLKFYDSVINYFPLTEIELDDKFKKLENEIIFNMKKKIGFLADISFFKYLFFRKYGFSRENVFNERQTPGRMYSFIAKKN